MSHSWIRSLCHFTQEWDRRYGGSPISISLTIFVSSQQWHSRCLLSFKIIQSPGHECRKFLRSPHFHKQRLIKFLIPLTRNLIFLPQYIGLQILEKLIQTRWKTLPEGQRQGELITQNNIRSVLSLQRNS